MKKRTVLILAAAFAPLMACDESTRASDRTDAAAASLPSAAVTAPMNALPAASTASPAPPPNPNADNSAMNALDAGEAGLTAGDQGGSEADRKITQQIRQAVVADGSLSMMAKNAKIITINGVVTLKGPVKSDQERASLEAAAKRVAGVSKVDNQLEIKK